MKLSWRFCVSTAISAVLTLVSGARADDNVATGISKQLIGKWQSGRHVDQFLPNHTWFMDPEPGDSPRGIWRLDGRKLMQTYSDGYTAVYTIVFISQTQLVLADVHDFKFTLRRVP